MGAEPAHLCLEEYVTFSMGDVSMAPPAFVFPRASQRIPTVFSREKLAFGEIHFVHCYLLNPSVLTRAPRRMHDSLAPLCGLLPDPIKVMTIWVSLRAFQR
jgi:hypothetical protein